MDNPALFIELGGVLVGLALLARLATRIGIPTVPLYLIAGLAFGEGGIAPLVTAQEAIEIGAELGLMLLLFMLGLEYTADQLMSTLRTQGGIGGIDLLLNFAPGFGAGLLLGWGVELAVILGGVTYVSSSGIIAKTLADKGWNANPETPVVISTLVLEDLMMALYIPLAGALLVGDGRITSLIPAFIGIAIVVVVLLSARKVETRVGRLVFSRSDESLLLTILGITVLIAGAAEGIGISAAVGALLVGIVLSGPAARAAQGLLSPLRDLFAAMFFAFVGLSVDPASIPPVLLPAALLGVVTLVTKFATGWLAASRSDVDVGGRIRAGALLVPRGEFSIAIAGLATAAGVAGRFEALAVTYVLVLAIAGPLFVLYADAWSSRVTQQASAGRQPT